MTLCRSRCDPKELNVERRHRRKYFILCSALGTMLDLFPADLISNSPRLHHQGTTALPSFRKGCASIAVSPRMIQARRNRRE